MDSARHVIGCQLTQETKVKSALGDVASTIHQTLLEGHDDIVWVCAWSPDGTEV